MKNGVAPGTFETIFFGDPGVPQGVFSDTQLNNQLVRERIFETEGAALVYGWFHNSFLVIGTSQEALEEGPIKEVPAHDPFGRVTLGSL